MSANDDLVLRFDRFPGVHNRRQQDADGRLWQITRIEAPWCWARPHGGDAGFTRYRIEVAQRRGVQHPLRLTAEQRPTYKKLRRSGVARADALAQIVRA